MGEIIIRVGANTFTFFFFFQSGIVTSDEIILRKSIGNFTVDLIPHDISAIAVSAEPEILVSWSVLAQFLSVGVATIAFAIVLGPR